MRGAAMFHASAHHKFVTEVIWWINKLEALPTPKFVLSASVDACWHERRLFVLTRLKQR